MKGFFVTSGMQSWIEVDLPRFREANPNLKDNYNLWDGIIEHCAKDLSNNEMRELYKQLCIQLSRMDKDDIPFCYLEMMEEYKKAMESRQITL